MMECREIQDFPGYWIYEDGRVWSDPKGVGRGHQLHGRFLSQPIDKDGYTRYCFRRDGNNYYKFAHVLVLEAFVGPCPEGMECRHLDGNPQNNHVSNLCWGTTKENMNDKNDHGTMAIGSRNGKSKLTEKDVLEIKDLLKGSSYFQREIGEFYGVTQMTVSTINRGDCWKEV